MLKKEGTDDMSSKKTQNLELHVWEPEDLFLREEFNENTEKIDAALGAARQDAAGDTAQLRGETQAALTTLQSAMNSMGAQIRQEFSEETGELNAALGTASQNAAGDTAQLRSETQAALAALQSTINNIEAKILWVKVLDTTLNTNTTRWDIDVSNIDFFRYAELHMFVETPATSMILIHVNGVTTSGSYDYQSYGSTKNTRGRLVEMSSPHKHIYRIVLVHPKAGHEITAVIETTGSGYLNYQRCSAPVNWEVLQSFNLLNLYEGDVVPAGTRVILMGMKK